MKLLDALQWQTIVCLSVRVSPFVVAPRGSLSAVRSVIPSFIRGCLMTLAGVPRGHLVVTPRFCCRLTQSSLCTRIILRYPCPLKAAVTASVARAHSSHLELRCLVNPGNGTGIQATLGSVVPCLPGILSREFFLTRAPPCSDGRRSQG